MNSKKSIQTILGLIGFYALSASAIASTTTGISFSMSNIPKINQPFSINVLANGIVSPEEIIGFGFDSHYDASWTPGSVQVGSNFSDDSSLYTDTQVVGSAFPSGPSGDNILLATLQFTPSKAGSYNFSIASDLTDANEGLILFNTNDPIDMSSSLTVNVAPVPLPGANLLFGFGLFGLRYFRKSVRNNTALG